MITQYDPDVICVDVTQAIGYPAHILINRPNSAKPLCWTAHSGTEQISEGGFLESPGLPLAALLGDDLHALPRPVFDVVQAASPCRQFAVLQAILSSRQAQELALSNPMLFLLVVEHAVQNGIHEHDFQQLVCSKRKHILQHLGLVVSTSTLKILDRMRLQLRHDEDVLTLIRVLQQPALVNHLRHLPSSGLATFQLLCRNPQQVWPGLLSMLDDGSTIKDVLVLSRLVRDTQNMGVSWHALRQTQTRQDLQRLHDRMVWRFNQAMAKDHALSLRLQHGGYPPPPRCGSSSIAPLTTWEELLQEGNCMQHCVGSYSGMIAAGEVFIYKVTAPERLTLSLRRKPHGCWVLDELKGFQNAEPGAQALEAVHSWLHSGTEEPQQAPVVNARQAVPTVANTELLEQVTAFVRMRGRCSISEIQRRFRLGYNAAVSLARCLPEQP
ncbi:MAG: hypothetical protein GX665_02290 [Gammaproteobacteria bacterium]|nr:hypothetical protein [Gammaproteobacteria bacterium]